MKRIILALLVSLGLQTQAQQPTPYFCCDSISYWTDQGQGLFIGLDTSGMVHNPDSMMVIWQVCNSNTCYSAEGVDAYFANVLTTDTLKVCYDIMIYEAGIMEVCTRCDSLVFDQNTYTWLLYNSQGNSTSIAEIVNNALMDNKIYDLMGKELMTAPKGVMYIRNRRLVIEW